MQMSKHCRLFGQLTSTPYPNYWKRKQKGTLRNSCLSRESRSLRRKLSKHTGNKTLVTEWARELSLQIWRLKTTSNTSNLTLWMGMMRFHFLKRQRKSSAGLRSRQPSYRNLQRDMSQSRFIDLRSWRPRATKECSEGSKRTWPNLMIKTLSTPSTP